MKLWALLALLLGSVLCGEAAPAPGDRLSPFTLRTQEGSPWRWNPGRATVLTFYASWCDTWKTQLPRVAEARRITAGLPVDYATVSVDGRWSDRVRSQTVGKMLVDPGGEWTRRIGIDRVPYTLVVDKTGQVAWAGYGAVRTESVVKSVRSAVIGAESGGNIYLTFDDFPSERGSYELLNLLRAQGVPATIFCIGSRVVQNAELLRMGVRAGDEFEIHSWSHDAQHPQLDRCVEAMQQALGESPRLYRPPGSESILKLEGGELKLPEVDPYDYTRPGVNELIRRILLAARPDAVLQLHAGVSDTIAALPRILSNLKARGYRFLTLREAQ